MAKETKKSTKEVVAVSLAVASEIVKLNLNSGAKLPPMLWGPPAIGKSAIVNSVGKELNLKVVDLRLTAHEAQDLSGIPRENEVVAGKAPSYTYIPFDLFLLETSSEEEVKRQLTRPDGGMYDGIIYFLDELSSISSEDMKAASYKFLLDRAVGQYKLHPKTHIVCAGNQATDRAIVNDLGTALSSRLTHVHVKYDFATQMAYMKSARWSNVILAFHEFTKNAQDGQDNLYRFNPEKKAEGVAFPAPRTWEAVNKIVMSPDFRARAETLNYDGTDKEKRQVRDVNAMVLQSAFIGLLGYEVANTFLEFIRNYYNVQQFTQIRTNPESAPLPNSMHEAYAVCSYICNNILEEQGYEDNYLKYLIRVAKEAGSTGKGYLEIAKQSIAYMNVYQTGSARLQNNKYLLELEGLTSRG